MSDDLDASNQNVSESSYSFSQMLREWLASNPTLPQLIPAFGQYVELYLSAAHNLYCVFEAQNQSPSDYGPYFAGQRREADQVWRDAKRDVLLCGERLAREMTAEGFPAERLLKLCNGIRRDGEHSGCPGGVKLADWQDIEAWLQQLALQIETEANKRTAQTEQAEGTGAGSAPAEGERAEGTGRRPRKQRGRPSDTDPKADKRIYDAWQTGHYKDYAALANEMRTTKLLIQQAIDRERKRRK